MIMKSSVKKKSDSVFTRVIKEAARGEAGRHRHSPARISLWRSFTSIITSSQRGMQAAAFGRYEIMQNVIPLYLYTF